MTNLERFTSVRNCFSLIIVVVINDDSVTLSSIIASVVKGKNEILSVSKWYSSLTRSVSEDNPKWIIDNRITK